MRGSWFHARPAGRRTATVSSSSIGATDSIDPDKAAVCIAYGLQIVGVQSALVQLVPHTTVSPASNVPHTTVSPPSMVPHTTVSPSSDVPQTTVSPSFAPLTELRV